MLVALTLAVLTLGQSDTVVLDNNAIRIEVDPAVFCVRFVGLSGGDNFVSPNHVSRLNRAQDMWVDPGGLYTVVMPDAVSDVAIERGPAQVVEQSPLYLKLRGPVSEKTGLFVEKSVQLDESKARAWYRVEVRRVEGTSRHMVCSVADLPVNTTVNIRQQDGVFHAPDTLPDSMKIVTERADLWTVLVPNESGLAKASLSARVPLVLMQRTSAEWERRLARMSGEGDTLFLDMRDDRHQYEAAFRSATVTITPEHPLVLEEEWLVRAR